jgi:hypothetical protein
LLALAGLLLCAPAALAVGITFDLYTTGNQSTAMVTAGGTLPLYVYLSTSPATGVGALFYTVECPNASWAIATRDYASHGWLHHDGTYDHSTPMPADVTFPVAITSSLFAGYNPGVADFSFDTIRNPAYGATITGGVVETFTLVVPTTPGDYVLGFGDMSAYDGAGAWLADGIGHDFTVRVLAVPEPSGLWLLGLAAAGAAGRRRRRNRS